MANRHGNGLAKACHTLKKCLSQDEIPIKLPSFICLSRRRNVFCLLQTWLTLLLTRWHTGSYSPEV